MNKRDILTRIYEVLRLLADRSFQQRIWLRGEGPEVSSYVEMMCTLFDEYNFDVIIDKVPYDFHLSDVLVLILSNLRNRLNNFQGEEMSPAEILDNFEWKEIQKISAVALGILENEMN